MSNIHISLVGGQVYPVYLGIEESKPDEVILIHSSSTKEEALRVKEEIKIPVRMELFNPVDFSIIFNQVKKLVSSLSEINTYTVNITSGTKLWSIAFYEILKSFKNVEFIYIDQNNIIYDLSSGTKHSSDISLNTDNVFRLNGNVAKSYQLVNEYTDEDDNMMKNIEKIREDNFNSFLNLTTLLSKEQINILDNKKSGSWTYEESLICWDKPSNIVSISIKNKRGIKKNYILESPNIFHLVFNSGWFEYKVARILSQWKYAKEVRLNVKFPYEDNKPKNEIDIIVNTGNRLLFVECKTQISNITDIDKFRTAVKNYGGMGCKALFITEAKMKVTANEKCSDSGIATFSFEDCNSGLFTPQEGLFLKLEQELFEINKK